MIRVLYVGSGLCSARNLASELPKYLLEKGVELDVVVPHTQGIDEGTGRLAERLVLCKAQLDGEERAVTVLEGRSVDRIRTFYLDDECLRAPLSLVGEDGARACAVYAQAVCDWIMKSPVAYDIVHCEGLETALIPTLIRRKYSDNPRMSSVHSLVFVPGIEDKGLIDLSWVGRLGLPGDLSTSEGMEFYGRMSILKGAYLHADAVCFANGDVKRRIENNRGKDIGMEGVLFNRLDRLHTIGLGLNVDVFNPETDRAIEANFSASDISGKARCRAALTKKYRLAKDRPVVTFIGDLNGDSGIDPVNDILEDLMDRRVNLVIVGTGVESYRNAVESWKQEFRGNIAWIEDKPCGEALRRILSASDILLLPRKFECACRLHAMAMRYGCVVVARTQGSVAHDIVRVKDIEHVNADATGFSCSKYDSDAFFDAAMDALDLIETPAWAKICENAMRKIVSLSETANDCRKIYDALNPAP